MSSGPSNFDLSVSARPRGSEAAGGREKTKTENVGGPGARALYSSTPEPSGVQSRTPRGSALGVGRGMRVRGRLRFECRYATWTASLMSHMMFKTYFYHIPIKNAGREHRSFLDMLLCSQITCRRAGVCAAAHREFLPLDGERDGDACLPSNGSCSLSCTQDSTAGADGNLVTR